jgi:hypothetical protein
MPDYRRNRVAGAAYCFTVNLLDRRSALLVTHIDGMPDARFGGMRCAVPPYPLGIKIKH